MRRYRKPTIVVSYQTKEIYAAAAASFGSPGSGDTLG